MRVERRQFIRVGVGKHDEGSAIGGKRCDGLILASANPQLKLRQHEASQMRRVGRLRKLKGVPHDGDRGLRLHGRQPRAKAALDEHATAKTSTPVTPSMFRAKHWHGR